MCENGAVDDVELGRRVRAAREAAGVSVRKLAEVLGLDVAALSRTESGARSMKARELVAVAQTLHMPLDVLVGVVSPDHEAAARETRARAGEVAETVDAWVGAVARLTTVTMDTDERELYEFPSELQFTMLADPLPTEHDVLVPERAAPVVMEALDGLAARFRVVPIPDDVDGDAG